MKILYLYGELMGYQIPILKEYVEHYKAEVHVVHNDNKKFTPYRAPLINNVFYYNKSEFSKLKLIDFTLNLNPDIVYISGWMYKDYVAAAKALRKREIPVVSGFDDIWKNTLRQRIASVVFPFVRDKYFSHAWVAGPYQYEFAKNLGFPNNRIIFNCLSADLKIFNDSYSKSIALKSEQYPHRILYAGRFEPIKGVDLLVSAWNNIRDKKKDWELCLIGNGSLKNRIENNPGIIVKNFMQPELLVEEIEKCGCFILPSRKDQWGLVLHEFSAAGLPIICSDACGAAPVFVTPGFNGYVFKSNDVSSMENKMLRIINSTDQELNRMAVNSHLNGQKITSEMSAASFLSVLD